MYFPLFIFVLQISSFGSQLNLYCAIGVMPAVPVESWKRFTNSTKLFGARFEMVANNSTVTHCQHLPILLNCQCNISIKNRFKSLTVTFTKRLQNKNPKTHRAHFSWLIFVCLGNKSVLQKSVHQLLHSSVDLTVAWDDCHPVVELSVQGFYSDSSTIAWKNLVLRVDVIWRMCGSEDSRISISS